MAFDGCMMAAVVRECEREAVGAKIEKIYQPSRDELVLCLRGISGSRRLLLNAGSQNPRLHLTESKTENPDVPPMFCMMMRKHLSGAKLAAVAQEGFERVARLTFDSYDDLGFPTQKYILCEVMGKYSNLMLTDKNDRVLAVLHPVDFSTSQKRQVLPGMTYELPPPQDKANPLEATEESFVSLAAAEAPDRSAEKFLTSRYLGISSLTARQVVFSVTGDATSTLAACGKPLATAFLSMIDDVKAGKATPCLAFDESGHAAEYGTLPLTQYGEGRLTFPDTFGAMLDRYFAERGRVERVRQRGEDILKLLKNAESRLERKMALQEEELTAAGDGERYRLWGDLITANIYRMKRGMTEITLEDYMNDMAPVKIDLDSRLTPAANAQRYYKKYNKLKSAKVHLEEQLSRARGELDYLLSVADALSRADGERELGEIRQELAAGGYGNGNQTKGPQRKQAPTVLHFTTTDGRSVLCGKNNLANDYLTFRLADRNDWWFHAKGQHGAHVVMDARGDEPTDRDFTEAAMIAARYSGLSEGQNVAVDYTRVRQVKKPPASKPGYVIYHTNWTAYVTPDADAVERLLSKK